MSQNVILPQFRHVNQLRKDDAGMGNWHDHDATELLFMVKGTCRVLFREHFFVVNPGEAVVIPSGYQHRLEWQDAICAYRLRFITDATLFDQKLRRIKGSTDPLLSGWFEELISIRKRDMEMAVELGGGLVFCILKQVTRLEQQRDRRSQLHPALVRALQILQESPVETTLSLSELASRALVSPSYLSALFKKTFGMGPIAYGQDLRLGQAAHLLSEPHMTVGEAGSLVGYDDANYFSRLFRKHFGMPPGAYRRKKSSAAPENDI